MKKMIIFFIISAIICTASIFANISFAKTNCGFIQESKSEIDASTASINIDSRLFNNGYEITYMSSITIGENFQLRVTNNGDAPVFFYLTYDACGYVKNTDTSIMSPWFEYVNCVIDNSLTYSLSSNHSMMGGYTINVGETKTIDITWDTSTLDSYLNMIYEGLNGAIEANDQETYDMYYSFLEQFKPENTYNGYFCYVAEAV